MWARSSTLFQRSASSSLAMAFAATTAGLRSTPYQCDDNNTTTNPKAAAVRLRKRTTLKHANSSHGIIPSSNTPITLDRLRQDQTNILQRWERDEEDNWRQLPARAWPVVQPDPEHMKQLQQLSQQAGCQNNTSDDTTVCDTYAFQIATTMVFYGVDPLQGLKDYRRLADEKNHVDAMVASGVVLVEGLLGTTTLDREKEETLGVEYLQRAADKGSSQGQYELATVYYVGAAGVEEDEQKAFQLFEKAATQDHTAALYMMAECLVLGEGTERNVERAVPLFYRAAERGHRFARQRIRELLSEEKDR